MSERGITFTAESIPLLLNDQKTQTRRVIMHQGHALDEFAFYEVDGDEVRTEDGKIKACPYGRVGDRLWVKETWGLRANENRQPFEIYEVLRGQYDLLRRHVALSFQYRAKGEDAEMFWRSSRYMPKRAARIWLEIVALRVDRVQEISEADAIAEGVNFGCDSVDWFRDLWDSINAKRGFGWDVNPWVRAITFRRIKNELRHLSTSSN